MVRQLHEDEVAGLLASDTVARLATIDANGYPHVTPLWFIWDDGRFLLASDATRPHLARIRGNPKVGLVIDVEDDERFNRERPNRQVRVVGDATLSPDSGGTYTKRIWAKYQRGKGEPDAAARLRGRQRVLITIRPRDIVTVASI